MQHPHGVTCEADESPLNAAVLPVQDNFGMQYKYDAEGRVATAGSWSYSYDGDGRRVLKTAGGNTGFTYWYRADGLLSDEQSVFLSIYGWPGNLNRMFYLNGHMITDGGFPAGTIAGAYYLLYDQVGSNRVTVDFHNGNVISTNYFPFGKYVSPPTDNMEQRFTGKERDAESGNDYFGARYYSSSTGRMSSPDPSGLFYADPTNPQSLNLYSYVLNNPLGYTDPTGMECVWDDGSFDSKDDKQTGSSKSCSKAGGTWIDPKAFSTLNAGDWSDKANSTIAGIAQDLNSTSTTIVVSAQQQQMDPDDARIMALVQGVAQDTAGFPDVCSGGAFVYAGVQGPLGKGKDPAHGFAGYLGNYDSKEGWSNNLLVEGSKGNASGGAAGGSKGAEGLVFVPFAEAGGGLVGVSKQGLSIGGYAGTPEKFPVGAGGGAYFTISSMGACARHR